MSNISNSATVNLSDVLTAPYYGMVYLGLANIAYTSQGDLGSIVHDFKLALTNTEYMPLLPDQGQIGAEKPITIEGRWQPEWGPVVTPKNSNMIYVASYRDKDDTALFYVVGIRGTDISTGVDGLINQILEDVEDFTLHSFGSFMESKLSLFEKVPTVNGGNPSKLNGRISQGSIKGFLELAKHTPELSTEYGYKNLVETIDALLKKQNAPVVVTGHSLGANQTQVVAAYLDWQFGDVTKIIPMPFAPPTPGDSDFASLPVFGNGFFWVNNYDVVPYAYITQENRGGDKELGLEWAKKNLWESYYWGSMLNKKGPKLPELMIGLIDSLGGAIPKVFSRPARDTIITLDGNIPPVMFIKELLENMNSKEDPQGSVAQLMWQHFPPNYKLLISEQMSDKVINYNYKSYPSNS